MTMRPRQAEAEGGLPDERTTGATPSHRLATRAPGSRAVIATILGNALEVFDFTVYALFAVQMGRVLFPAASSFGQLMLSVRTFGLASSRARSARCSSTRMPTGPAANLP